MFNSNNGGNGFSLSDIAAVLKGNGDDGILGGNGITAIILLIIVMAFFGGWNNGGGFGFGGGGNGASNAVPYVINASTNTDNEVSRGFADLTMNTKLDNLTSDVCSGFANSNAVTQQGFSNLATNLCGAFDGVNSNITNLGYTMQSDLLQLSNAIEGVKYENAANTAQIVNATNAGVQRIADLMAQSEIQSLRDQLQNAQFENSQAAQTASIISQLQPVARPSYIVSSPYASQMYGANYCPCMNA